MCRREDERGASLVEYALLVAMIALVAIGGIRYFGTGSNNSLDNSKSKIVEAYERP
jgi:Flp pilus assembly pilin Flp